MGTEIDIPVAERIAKLIRLLASDQDGEVMATVQAIKRTLDTNGLDLHALADIVVSEKRSGANKNLRVRELNKAYRDGFQDGYDRARSDRADGYAYGHDEADAPTPYQMAKYCAHRLDQLLDDRERSFIKNMVRWTAHGRALSDKQMIWLSDAYSRLGGPCP